MKKTRLNYAKQKSPWSKELKDLMGGASGGFLFGIPLVYTMEVWYIGSYTKPSILLLLLGVTFVTVFLLTRAEGFRKTDKQKFTDTLSETIEALAIGFVCAGLMLFLLQQITLDTPVKEVLGKVIFEGVPFSIGVALSRLILSGDSRLDDDDKNDKKGNQTLTDLGATLIGAVIIAFNIAPTDEVTTLAASASPPWLLGFMGASLIISYIIVFSSGFTNQSKRHQQQGIFQKPQSETVFSYLVSLFASALMLWFFQKLSLSDPWFLWLRCSIVLALPATVGGAAGRLAV